MVKLRVIKTKYDRFMVQRRGYFFLWSDLSGVLHGTYTHAVAEAENYLICLEDDKRRTVKVVWSN